MRLGNREFSLREIKQGNNGEILLQVKGKSYRIKKLEDANTTNTSESLVQNSSILSINRKGSNFIISIPVLGNATIPQDQIESLFAAIENAQREGRNEVRIRMQYQTTKLLTTKTVQPTIILQEVS